MTSDSIRGSSDRSILILTSLADWPKHGYALIKDIESFAGVKLGQAACTAPWPSWSGPAWSRRCPPRTGAARTRSRPAGREFLYARLTESARIAEIGLRRIAAAWS